jgi:hypothetical protein
MLASLYRNVGDFSALKFGFLFGARLASAAAGVRALERCLACEADFKRVARDTSAMADKCEADHPW